ncbi:MAG: TetR/AcrR family transcriptional regulator [Coriobacteriales bacterium]|jgi:AcrR family transcriptional regulator|nr:TetR/AcrR family transcriptional regulator [Coriobacteriales bacterium]
MTNKTDLRFVKTERLIEETYLKLKKEASASVKVSELCAKALINKSTFYSHYETMEALDEYVCAKEVGGMLAHCPNIDDAFADTPAFVESLVKMIKENLPLIEILFKKDTIRQLSVFESCLLQRYLHGNESPQMEMKIIFAIGGAARLLITNQDKERIRMTIQLIKLIFDSGES